MADTLLIVTQCFPPQVGGIETLMGGLAAAAAAAGSRVEVFADGPAAPEDADQPYTVRRFEGWKPLRRRAKAQAIAARLAEGGVGRIIADSWKSAALAPPPGAGRPPLACLAHGMEFPAKPGMLKVTRIRAALAKADLIQPNSQWTADQAYRFAHAGAEIRVTPLPIAPQPPAPTAALEAFRARLAVQLGGPPTVLIASLCRLEPRKGVDRVISAMESLIPKRPGLALVVAGDGPDRDRLESLAEAGRAAKRILFLGRVDETEKAALLAASDLFAMPARREGDSVEGFGLVYLEAGWYGSPSLAGRDGGAAEAVKDGETGLLCDGKESRDVTQTLARLIDDPVLRASLGAAAAEYARRQIWARRVGEYVADERSA